MSKFKTQHKARKRFGQNFLIDHNIINQIISAIAPESDQYFIEVGPGKGALTELILPQVKHLDAIELDKDLIPYLLALLIEKGDIKIHNLDILKLDIETLNPHQKHYRVFGNIPYNISSPLLFHLIKQKKYITDMLFMFQKEFAERLVAEPNTKSYGRLSVMLQYHCEIEYLFSVRRECFVPSPQVDSSIVRLTPYKKPPIETKNYQQFSIIVREAFNQRRKTLRNSLKKFFSEEQLKSLNIDPLARAENLSVSDYVNLSHH